MMTEKIGDRKTVFLDIGANLGIHGLYAAKMGYRVWAVEPQKNNLLKVQIKVMPIRLE